MKKLNTPGGAAFARSLFARNVSDVNNFHPLTAATAKKVTLPTDAKYVEVVTDQPLYARFGASNVADAVAPSAEVTNGSACVPVKNGDVLCLPVGATHVSLIAAANAKVSLAYFAA